MIIGEGHLGYHGSQFWEELLSSPKEYKNSNHLST
jgi:hypothetical protein